jgi:Tfp pilus assembly PilM family ATPase
MAKFKKSSVGVYIGNNYVSVVELKGRLGTTKVSKFKQVEVSPKDKAEISGSFQVGAAESKKASGEEINLIAAVQRALREAGIITEDVYTSLPGKDVMVRIFEMPRIPKSEWETAIKFESRKYIPFKPEDIIYDFQVIEDKVKENKLKVLFVASKKETVERQVSLLRQAGLRVLDMEMAPFSLMRIFQVSGWLNRAVINVIVDLDLGNTGNINIVKDGLSLFCRDISIYSLAFGGSSDKKVLLDNLVDEIHSSFNYFRGHLPADVSVGKVVLCGEGIQDEWVEPLGKELGVPVEKRDPLVALGAKSGGFSSPVGLSIAAGAALKAGISSGHDVSLHKEEKVLFKRKGDFLKIALVNSVAAILLLAIFYSFITKGVSSAREELDRAKRELSGASATYADFAPADLQFLKSRLEQKLSAFKGKIDERIYLTVKLDILARSLPDGVWLKEIFFEETETAKGSSKREFLIKGSAFKQDKEGIELVNEFYSNLKQNELFLRGFGEVKLTSISRDQVGDFKVTNFELLCSLQ